MKKLISGMTALTIMAAMAMPAFADTQIKQDTANQTGAMTAEYDVAAKYTVTIPAGVELNSVGGGEVSKKITAEDVLLESGQQIYVKLEKGSNTSEGSEFSAKNEAGTSTANYTITAGDKDVAVGDTVATFGTSKDDQSATLTFSEARGATDAGKHTETLTFTIGVENAAVSPTTKTLTIGDVTINYNEGDTWEKVVGYSNNSLSIFSKNKEWYGYNGDTKNVGAADKSWIIGDETKNYDVYATDTVDPSHKYFIETKG